MGRHVARLGAFSLALVLASAVLYTSTPTEPATAATILTGYRCAPSGCKYAKAQIMIDRVIKKFYRADYRGGTASQACDPSNDIIQWNKTKISATSGMTWSVGAGGWHTNCNVDSFTYSHTVNKYWWGGLDVKFEFFHDAQCYNCDFPSIIFQYG